MKCISIKEPFIYKYVNKPNKSKMELYMDKCFDVLGNEKDGICCICGKPYDNYGNNAKPFRDGRCCDNCAEEKVRPLRHYMIVNDIPFQK